MNKVLIIVFSIISMGLMVFSIEPMSNFSNRVFISSLLIQLIAVFFIFRKENTPYSLNKIVSLFVYFFYGVAPLLQFYDGASFFGARPLKETEYFYMNLLIIFIFLFYQISYYFFLQRKITNSRIRFFEKFSLAQKLNPAQTLLLIGISLFSFFIVFWANNFNLFSLFFRGGALKESAVESGTTSLIIFRTFQPLAMMCLLYYILSPSKKKVVYLTLTVSALLTCFPLAMARFSAAALYIPLLLIAVPIMRKKNIFSLSVVGGLLLVFPFLNNFRYFSENTEIKTGLDLNMFLAGDFDSYQNFTLIVFENIITWGRQLLGVLLFWLPRSFWPDKPIGSGAFMAQQEGFFFDNVSCNFFAEGYINFGFWGLVLFILLLSFVSARLDKTYWQIIYSKKHSYFHVIYMVLIGMLFFILRGDLMSSFAYTVGFLISIWFVYKVMKMTVKK